jgi:hypothetical protein
MLKSTFPTSAHCPCANSAPQSVTVTECHSRFASVHCASLLTAEGVHKQARASMHRSPPWSRAMARLSSTSREPTTGCVWERGLHVDERAALCSYLAGRLVHQDDPACTGRAQQRERKLKQRKDRQTATRSGVGCGGRAHGNQERNRAAPQRLASLLLQRALRLDCARGVAALICCACSHSPG